MYLFLSLLFDSVSEFLKINALLKIKAISDNRHYFYVEDYILEIIYTQDILVQNIVLLYVI